VREFFDLKWTAIPGAQYYLLEGDDDPNFSAPQTLNVDPMQFGTTFNAGWGNSIPNVYYRVRAVSVDNIRGLPSPTLNVKIVNPRRFRRRRSRCRRSAARLSAVHVRLVGHGNRRWRL
jgi:hypothetical protein